MERKLKFAVAVPLLALAGCNAGSNDTETTSNNPESGSGLPPAEYLSWEMPEITQELTVTSSDTVTSRVAATNTIQPQVLEPGEVYGIKGSTGDKIVLSLPEAHFTLWVNGVEFSDADGLQEYFLFGLESEVIEVADGTFQFAQAASQQGLESGSDFWHQIVVGNLESEFTFIAWNEDEQTDSFETIYTDASFDLRLEVRELPSVESEPWSGTWQVTKDKTKTGGDAQCDTTREESTRDVRVAFGQWFEAEYDNIWMWDGSIDVAGTEMTFDAFSSFEDFGESDTAEIREELKVQGSGTATEGGFTITGTVDEKTTDFVDGRSTLECQFDFTETGHL